MEPQPRTTAPQKSTKPGRSNIPPWARYAMEVHEVVLKWTEVIAPGGFDTLIAELHDKVDYLHELLRKRAA